MDREQVCSIIASNQVCQLSPTRLAIVSRTAHYCRPFRHQLSDDINQPNSTNLRFATDTLTFSCSLATIGRLEYSPPSGQAHDRANRQGEQDTIEGIMPTCELCEQNIFGSIVFFIYFCRDKNNKNNETYKGV